MIWRAMLSTAALTGLFCVGFTLLVDAVTDIVDMRSLVMLSFVSGFLGSLVAQMVMKRRDR